MINKFTLEQLGYQVKIHRENLELTQQELVDKIQTGVNRSNVAHLEQGKRLPPKNVIKLICENISLPKEIWEPYLNDLSINRLNFEVQLKELIGVSISAVELDDTIIKVVEKKISELFTANFSQEQILDCFNSIVVFYGVRPLSKYFFNKYITKDSFKSIESFISSIEIYQKDAIRLFSTLSEAYYKLNISSELDFKKILAPLENRNTDDYASRTDWDRINKIPDTELPYLGYIAASKVREEENERKELSNFLLEIAKKQETGTLNIDEYGNKKKKRMDSLLRKFNSTIENGLFSPMFKPEVETLKKEAEYIAPDDDKNIVAMENTQTKAYDNLSNYLTADYMDVYVATSMRNNADFVSVNNFVESLFSNSEVRQLKLRYFNPTQSWIKDRVAKGLVEALMLKRADLCIYMAQKDDTFGKDSEASVTLGQGKPVIVYVPKLYDEESGIDTEKFGRMERVEIIKLIKDEGEQDIDELEDNEALHSTLLDLKLDKFDLEDYIRLIKNHWADFDLEPEFSNRIKSEEEKSVMKNWFTNVINNVNSPFLDSKYFSQLKSIFVAASMRFERRAKVFREVHPLALQVILSTGVLNGILVVRSIDSCAKLVSALIENKLELVLETDEDNYKLVEKNTRSTIRVISKHKLISNAFKTYYNMK